MKGLCKYAVPSDHKEGGSVQIVYTQFTSWTNQRVAKQGRLKALMWHIWTMGNVQNSEGLGCKFDICEYWSPD